MLPPVSGTIRSPQVVEFLTRLIRQIPIDLDVIWDGLRRHPSRLVRDLVRDSNKAMEIESLPADGPELNPVDYLWKN